MNINAKATGNGLRVIFLNILKNKQYHDFLVVAKPPNLELFAIAFATDDLATLTRKLQNHGIKILSGPIELSISDHESANAIVVEGPNGVNLQFFESKI